MKRSLALLLSFVLLFSLTACSTEPTSSQNTIPTETKEIFVQESGKEPTPLPEETLPESTKSPETSSVQEEESSGESTDISKVGNGSYLPISLSDIPFYSGTPYTILQNNIPNFSADELKSKGYESYSSLDALGRTKSAIACVGKDTMPKEGEKRGSISSIHPSGWVQAQYDHISGKYLYNRCHLMGWQLSAENANAKNLITGTKYLNVSGMLPFENMVADYIKETENHVAYRITPIYDGNNLLASGVEMEAYSVEDQGDGICFHIYCYNVQPGVTINYTDGTSSLTVIPPTTTAPITTTAPVTTTAPITTTVPVITTNPQTTQRVFTTKTGKRYHSRESCSGLNNAKEIFEKSISEAKESGLTPCQICYE